MIKKKITKKIKQWVLLLIPFTLALTGCDKNAEDVKATVENWIRQYAGPGSSWSLACSDSLCLIKKTNGDNFLSIETREKTLSTNHIKLTVTNTQSQGVGSYPEKGDIYYGMEIPGTLFLLSPKDGTGETISLIRSGKCPTENFSSNWIVGHSSDAISSSTNFWFGTLNWNQNSRGVDIPKAYSLESPSDNLSRGVYGFSISDSCDKGRGYSGDRSLEVYLTNSQLILIKTSGNTLGNKHIIGIPQSTITSHSLFAGTYSGFIYDGDKTHPATASYLASGDLSLQELKGDDLETKGLTYQANMDGLNTPEGFISGSLSSCQSNQTCNIVCSVAQNVGESGKNLLYCVGQKPPQKVYRLTVLLIQQ